MNKKGLSPAIATALLISLALILAALIFIWASSFLKEKAEKFGEPVERACEKINFEAEAYDGELHVVNRGSVAIQSFEIKKKGLGVLESVGTVGNADTISEGETGVFTITGVNNGDEIVVTPIILGLEGEQKTPHYCDGSELNVVVG